MSNYTPIKLSDSEQAEFQKLVIDFFSYSFAVLHGDWNYSLDMLRNGEGDFSYMLEETPEIDGINWGNRAEFVRTYHALKKFMAEKDFPLHDVVHFFGGLDTQNHLYFQ